MGEVIRLSETAFRAFVKDIIYISHILKSISFLDLCALTASEESVSSFIVPQVRGDKDWFYKIKIIFLQQNYNSLLCNIFRYPM